jgi:hypothetical protein
MNFPRDVDTVGARDFLTIAAGVYRPSAKKPQAPGVSRSARVSGLGRIAHFSSGRMGYSRVDAEVGDMRPPGGVTRHFATDRYLSANGF